MCVSLGANLTYFGPKFAITEMSYVNKYYLTTELDFTCEEC